MTHSSQPAAAPVVTLLSGGIDSVTLLHHLRKALNIETVHAISVRYGQRHARELEMAAWQARQAGVATHHVVDLSFYGELIRGSSALTDDTVALPDLAELSDEQRRQPPTYVPNRNLVLLSLAAGYAETIGARDLFYGAQQQDEYGYWDCTPHFIERLNRLLDLNRATPVRVQAPFVGTRKADVVRQGLALGVDYAHTWSCYRGGAQPCGSCPSCTERQAAFAELGVTNGTPPATTPHGKEGQ